MTPSLRCLLPFSPAGFPWKHCWINHWPMNPHLRVSFRDPNLRQGDIGRTGQFCEEESRGCPCGGCEVGCAEVWRIKAVGTVLELFNP